MKKYVVLIWALLGSTAAGLILLLCGGIELIQTVRFGAETSGLDNGGGIVENDLDLIEIIHSNNNNNYSQSESNLKRLDCTLTTCFNVYKCQRDFKVYLYPLKEFRTSNGGSTTFSGGTPSIEFLDIRRAIRRSPYFTLDPERACLFIPRVDTLSAGFYDNASVQAVNQILHNSHEHWRTAESGSNHLIFTFTGAGRHSSVLATGQALIASGFDVNLHNYRDGFDVAVPVWNPNLNHRSRQAASPTKSNLVDLSIFALGLHKSFQTAIFATGVLPTADSAQLRRIRVYQACSGSQKGSVWTSIDNNDLCVIEMKDVQEKKQPVPYEEVFKTSRFCVLFSASSLFPVHLADSIRLGCIPIVITDIAVLPFSSVLDWKRFSVRLYKRQLNQAWTIARDIPAEKMDEMRHQLAFVRDRYFSSIEAITLTTLKIIEDRVHPHNARSYEDWNERIAKPYQVSDYIGGSISDETGFTVVILAYDRIPSLFKSVQSLQGLLNLNKIIVVWNNPIDRPPPDAEWPKIDVPLVVIKMKQNLLGNRFLAFKEIETDAVFSIDDDIVHLLDHQHIQFAYQTWREFPDHLIGFPSRVHEFDSATGKYAYNSEWTNNSSFILTGAAFYHKFYGWWYSRNVPKEVEKVVNTKMNCEDIAFNFVYANFSGLPSIKVTPMKKFRCPECKGMDLSTVDGGGLDHLRQRSECIQAFSGIFNDQTLKTVQFRFDPNNYKSSPSDTNDLYPSIGNL